MIRMVKNRIGELVGIRYSIIQTTMNWVSGADLAGVIEEITKNLSSILDEMKQRLAAFPARQTWLNSHLTYDTSIGVGH